MDRRDARARQIQDEIRRVLLDSWDPLAVLSDPDWPRDEYDMYIGRIYGLLSRGATEDEIVDHLVAIDPSGGPSLERDRLRGVAQQLGALNIRL